MKHISKAIAARGKNDTERGKSIGASTRTTTEYRSGFIPKQWKILVRNPDLALAIYHEALDYASNQHNERRLDDLHFEDQAPGTCCECGATPAQAYGHQYYCEKHYDIES